MPQMGIVVVCPLYEWNSDQDEDEMRRLRTFPQVGQRRRRRRRRRRKRRQEEEEEFVLCPPHVSVLILRMSCLLYMNRYGIHTQYVRGIT